MMEIGILTYWGVANFGAFTQAYALNKSLTQMCKDKNIDICHIAYITPQHKELYKKSYPYKNFDRAWDTIPHIPFADAEAFEKYHFDSIITGSDAIWDYTHPEVGDDRHLIGNDLNADKIYSYATSFGVMTENSRFPGFVIKGLRKYSDISVRDENSRILVNDFLGYDPTMVVDPALLWDFKDDNNIPDITGKYGDRYILVYGENFPMEMIASVIRYAEKSNLKIIGAGLAPRWCDQRLFGSLLDPYEWLGLFRNASLVVTCTFHGLMMSLNFEKNILFYQAGFVKNRSQWLIEKLELEDVLLSNSLEKALKYKWDYKAINSNKKLLVNKSKEYLESILK